MIGVASNRSRYSKEHRLTVVFAAMLSMVLTPAAAVAGALGAWRFGADLGWTSSFFIADGLLSRYQLWVTLGIGAQASARFLNRWLAKRNELASTGDGILTLTDLDTFRVTLEVRQAELEGVLRNREGMAVESNADMLDQIQRATKRDLAIGSMERDSVRLSEVRAAIRRISSGTFGICVGCEEEITLKRLPAVPWSASFLVCREADNRRQTAPDNMLETSFLNPD